MAETVPADEPADDWRAVKIGVLLPDPPDEVGEWLGDASAFDAGGADALWVDSGPEPEWDVLALTAALSVVTFRALLVVAVPDSGDPPGGLARMLDTIGRLSRNRLALIAEPARRPQLAPGVAVVRRLPGQPGAFEVTGERWVTASLPEGREAWRAARAGAAEQGVRGLLVPAEPRLLDILRNPDDPGDRRDLILAQG